jgi:hypothetical protein
MRRTIVALGLSATLLLAGCGQAATAASAATDSDLTDAAVALHQVGFETGLTNTPSTGTDQTPRKVLRKYLRKNTLHGEVAIQTKKNGVRTVVVQRGAITGVTATSMSVKSSDGVTLTWAFDDKLRIVQNRKAAERSALTAGAEIGIAGTKDGDKNAARLIAIS